jgi:hypothetical protein
MQYPEERVEAAGKIGLRTQVLVIDPLSRTRPFLVDIEDGVPIAESSEDEIG